MQTVKAKDLYRGSPVLPSVQRRVLSGDTSGVHHSSIAKIMELGIVIYTINHELHVEIHRTQLLRKAMPKK